MLCQNFIRYSKMKIKYSNENLFPVIMHCFDCEEFNEIQNVLINQAYDLKKSEPEGLTISNRGGWHSKPFIVNDDSNLIESFLLQCLTQFEKFSTSSEIMLDAWFNINKCGDYNVWHNHPSSDLSGVLWIKSPENCGNLKFESPYNFTSYNELQSYTDDFKEETNFYPTYSYKPIEGRMLVFPSHLKHEVLENKSNEDRISVSFNIRF